MEHQLTILQGTSPAVQEATAMHFEIVEAAKTAANSLLELGRKLKRMRDSGRYKDLGFDTFGAYTEAAVGIRQRQAYNYIQVVETLPAQLIEENAAAGVTKLALLAQLGPQEREEIAGEGQLANITVAELTALVKEKNGLAEQLSLLQAQEPPVPVAEVQATEIDLEEIRRQAADEARREAEKKHKGEIEKAVEEARRDAWEDAKLMAADTRQQAEAEGRAAAKAEAERLAAAERKKANDARVKLEKALEEAKKSRAEAVEAARKEGFARGQESASEAARRADEERQAAIERAEALQKQLEITGDTETTRFLVLFDQLQVTYRQMADLLEEMESAGKNDKADKLRAALGKALEVITEE